MDRKRKSIFASHYDDNAATARAKKHHIDNNVNVPSLQNSVSDVDLQIDIQNICSLVDRIITTSEKGAAKLSPHFLQAAKDFSLALQHAPLFNKSLENAIENHSTMLFRNHTQSLPALPPITDDKLERAVFTHPGVSRDPKTTYDRLEILGDAYVELISTKLILKKFEQVPSGRVSQIREVLVKNETLAEYATRYGFDRRASVPHDHFNQPKRWIKTKGDIFEAYVAAVVLSSPNGYAVAETWLSQLWSPKLETFEETHSHLKVKETLARKIMGKGVKLKYTDEREPIQHDGGTQTFFIGVYLTGWGWSNKHLGSGQGLNKTIAGNKAAQQALENRDLIKEIVASKITHTRGSS
ncbi:ribonuclease III domain-containing protein [Aspergillus aurantiobrunneus]